MKPVIIAFALFACIILSGCKSKQAKESDLQQQYNQAHKQYVDDCVTPMTSGSGSALSGKSAPTPSSQQEAAQQQKCNEEAKRAGDLAKQLQAASQ